MARINKFMKLSNCQSSSEIVCGEMSTIFLFSLLSISPPLSCTNAQTNIYKHTHIHKHCFLQNRIKPSTTGFMLYQTSITWLHVKGGSSAFYFNNYFTLLTVFKPHSILFVYIGLYEISLWNIFKTFQVLQDFRK